MTNKKLLQEKYVELQLISMQIKQLEEQLNAIDQKTIELVNLQSALHNLHHAKNNTKSFVPLSPGVFVKGSIENTSEVLLNVGAGVMVRKDTHEAEGSIGKQIGQLEDITLELSQNLKEMAARAGKIEAEIDNLAAKEEAE